MKWTLCVLAILSPVLSWAQLAGNWAGGTQDLQGAHRIALHISGAFTAMKASANIPDQKLYNVPGEAITFLESTLEFLPYGICDVDSLVASSADRSNGCAAAPISPQMSQT